MAMYVLLTIFLFQEGASKSKKQFWYESFQNWQSEFLSIGVLLVLGIYMRQRGSPESKPVAAPHAATGH